MKISLHIPTESYGFVLLEVEQEEDGKVMTPEEVSAVYNQYAAAFKEKNGLTDEEMDTFVQKQLEGEGNHIETYNGMSADQQLWIQRIKRAKKRIDYKSQK
jgi:hypothetical protein